MDLTQTPREFNAQSRDSLGRALEAQPEGGSSLYPQGGLPVLLGVCESSLGGEVPESLDHSRFALTTRTDEEGRSNVAKPSAPDFELVPSQGTGLKRNR